jgi:hypothetical protein
MKAPFVNPGLFPGCSSKLQKVLQRWKRAFSFYLRPYPSAPLSNSANRGGGGARNQAGRRLCQKGRGRPYPRNQTRPQRQPAPNEQEGSKTTRTRSVQTFDAPEPVAFSSVPPSLSQAIRERESQVVGACLLGHQAEWAKKGASVWMQSLIQHGLKPS